MPPQKRRTRSFAPPSIQDAKRSTAAYARKMHAHGEPGITSAHDTRHVTSVANYAGRLVRYFGGTQKQKALASMAGHLHDRIRLPSEKLISREEAVKVLRTELAKERFAVPPEFAERLVQQAFAERARILARGGKISDYGGKVAGQGITSDELTAVFMKHRLGKQLGKNQLARVLNTIRLAGKLPDKRRFREDIVHSSLVFADKFFEANGAFIAFRRAYFMGEREDRRAEMQSKGWSVEDAAVNITLDETTKRIKAFSNLNDIPRAFHPFVRYQVGWQNRLKKGLEKREPWAVHLATELFKEGLKPAGRQRSLETMIREYRPIAKEDAAFKTETLRYFGGGLWKTFVRLTGRPK